MDSLVFSRELMTVDLQMRQDQLNSLDQFFGAALGMPQGLIISNEKRLFPPFAPRRQLNA